MTIKKPKENVVDFKPSFDFEGSKKGTLEALARLLNAFKIKVRYNEVFKDIEIEGPVIPKDDEESFNLGLGYLTSRCVEYGLPVQHLRTYLFTIARANKYNPVKDWIEKLPWDGESRLEAWYDTIRASNESVKRPFMLRWGVSAIAALYEPQGLASGGVLVLQGAQDIGKTEWFKRLLPDDMRKYFKDGLDINPSDRDSKRRAVSYWIVELGEIETTVKGAPIGALKAFLTSDRDHMRLSYAASESKFFRRTVYGGTVNGKRYLKDPTGNRRFFTISCLSIDHHHNIDMQQLWAEFKVLYDNKEPWFPTAEEKAELTESNKEHEFLVPWKESILALYDWDSFNLQIGSTWRWSTIRQVMEDIGERNINNNTRLSTAISLYLPSLNGNVIRSGRFREYAMPYLKRNSG